VYFGNDVARHTRHPKKKPRQPYGADGARVWRGRNKPATRISLTALTSLTDETCLHRWAFAPGSVNTKRVEIGSRTVCGRYKAREEVGAPVKDDECNAEAAQNGPKRFVMI